MADLEPPEIMISTAVKPTVAEGVRSYLSHADRLRMRIRTRDGAPLQLPSVGSQWVDPNDPSIVVVDVDRVSTEQSDGFDGDWLASTPFADT
ncbi:MAG: hypothetical protein MK085_12900, partial [Phycisphaerales bacterium]|nr:hypothetical protein [Phycisphaerales bacterium]